MFRSTWPHDSYRTMGNIDVCTQSELLEVKLPLVFLDTVGFSRPREGRYVSGSYLRGLARAA